MTLCAVVCAWTSMKSGVGPPVPFQMELSFSGGGGAHFHSPAKKSKKVYKNENMALTN